jgi:hypothetical protein
MTIDWAVIWESLEPQGWLVQLIINRFMPPSYPTVRITQVDDGNFTSAEKLYHAGIVAPPEAPIPFSQHPTNAAAWPDYARCVSGAPLARGSDHPDRSRMDFLCARIAYRWGHTVDEITDRLLSISPKARKQQPPYAATTARDAARSVEFEEPRR